MINDKADSLFDSLKKYQDNLKSMKSKEFIFDYV